MTHSATFDEGYAHVFGPSDSRFLTLAWRRRVDSRAKRWCGFYAETRADLARTLCARLGGFAWGWMTVFSLVPIPAMSTSRPKPYSLHCSTVCVNRELIVTSGMGSDMVGRGTNDLPSTWPWRGVACAMPANCASALGSRLAKRVLRRGVLNERN